MKKIILGLVTFTSFSAFAMAANTTQYCYCDSTEVDVEITESQYMEGLESCLHLVIQNTDTGKTLSNRVSQCFTNARPFAFRANQRCEKAMKNNSFCQN